MTETKDAAAASGEMVLLYHTGDVHGPMETAAGVLRPGQSLNVPKPLAAKIVANYRHIRYAADIVPGGAQASALAATEKAKLLAQIKQLEGQLADLGADVQTRVSEATAAAEKKVTDLTGRLQEFLEAKDKKGLEALQEKHADAVAEPAA